MSLSYLALHRDRPLTWAPRVSSRAARLRLLASVVAGTCAMLSLDALAQAPASPQAAPASGATSGATTAAPPARPVGVEVAKARQQNLTERFAAVGQFRSNETVVIRPEVAGRIRAIHFTDGQTVAKGALLVELDDAINRAEIAQAKAELAQLQAELGLAQNNLKRNEDLAAQKFISERVRDESAASVESARAKLDVARAKLELASSKASKMMLRAPFAGTLGLRNVSPGDYLKDGTDVVTLEDRRNLKLDFRVPEALSNQLKRGQTVQVQVEALPGQTLSGKIEALDVAVDANGRMLTARAKIDNAQGRLRAGMFAKVDLHLGQRDGAVLVPEEAMVAQGRDQFVFKVVDGVAQRVKVKPGLRDGAWVQVIGEVAAGDAIVRTGHAKIRGQQAPVQVITAGPPGGGAGNGAGGPAGAKPESVAAPTGASAAGASPASTKP